MRPAEALLAAVLFASAGPVAAQAVPAPVAPATGTTAPPAAVLPANRWTPVQIRQAFEMADADANGQLSRAEAQRLPLMPRSFEETDANKDGAIVLAEYESAFRP